MKFKFNKKKGFILLEDVAYLTIYLMIVSMGCKLLLEVKNIYYESIKENMNMNCIEEAFHMIDVMKIEDFDEVYRENNKIIFFRKISSNVWEKNKISEFNNNLVIEYYDIKNSNRPSNRNTILTKIDNFEVKKKGKLIYLTVERKGEKFTKCL